MTEYNTRTLGKVKEIIDNMTCTSYKISQYLIKLDEEMLYRVYRGKVAEVLSRKVNNALLKELWRSDELNRFLIAVHHNPDSGFDRLTRERFVEAFYVVGEDLLGQRYRGIYHSARREDFLREKEKYLTRMDIKKMINDEDFMLKYPLTHLLLRETFKIISRVKEKHGKDIDILIAEVIQREIYTDFRNRDVEGFLSSNIILCEI